MAIALKENRPVRGVEAIAERPNGMRVSFMPLPTPLRDASGALVGGVNMLVDLPHQPTEELIGIHRDLGVDGSPPRGVAKGKL